MQVKRLTNKHKDFIELTHQLDLELDARYGTQQSLYVAHNKIDPINTAIVGYIKKQPVACGCFRVIDHQIIEIKRMFVIKAFRRKGYAELLLGTLEKWGAELGFKKTILETGKGQPEAIHLYQKCGYKIIDNYGPYRNLENSVCMEKSFPTD